MIKNLTFLVGLVLLLGCEESLPPIDFSQTTGEFQYAVLSESDIPAPQDKTIVVEDLTGVRCSNCPKAAETAKNIKDKYKDKVAVVSIYPQEPKNLTTPYATFPDLRTDFAQLIASNLFGFSNQLPGGGINRRLFPGQSSLNIPFNTWINSADQIETEKALVNLTLSKTEVADKEYVITTDIVFTDRPVSNPFITILLTEDNIAHPQTTTTGTDQAYMHEHVLRSMYTPYNGSPVFSATSSLAPDRGISAKKSWEITIPDFVNVEEASIIVYINYNADDNKEIIQCQEIKLK
ncbi:MAG: hypothetical protein RLZZ337_1299 [Bacteroidota bacterium]|jgi:hypothetical protein